MTAKNPYAQGEREKLEALLQKDEPVAISDPVLWKGGLENILGVVRLLQHRCGFPEKMYQVKFNADVNALRLSDYCSRHSCQPGEHFWLVGPLIRGGDMDDWEADRRATLKVEEPSDG